MKKVYLAAGAAGLLLALGQNASAEGVETIGRTNFRSGPGMNYQVQSVVDSGVRVQVTRCIKGYAWCNVIVDGLPGWMIGTRLGFDWNGRRLMVAGNGQLLDIPLISTPKPAQNAVPVPPGQSVDVMPNINP